MIDYDAMEKSLEGEYCQTFKKVELYADMNGIHENIKADKMMNLLDLLTTAEHHGKPVDAVIGSDLEKFCREYFGDYDFRAQLRFIPEKIYNLACAFIFVMLIDILFPEKPITDLLHAQSDIWPFLLGIANGFVLSVLYRFLVGPLIFRSKKIPVAVYYVSVLLLFVATLVLTVCLIGDRQVLLPLMPFFAITVAYVVIYLVVRSVLRYQRTGSIRKPKLVSREFEFHMFSQNAPESGFARSMEEEVRKVMTKRYHKINKRRVRKRQAEMTSAAFIQKMRKEDARIPLYLWGLGIFYAGLIVMSFVDGILSHAEWHVTLCFTGIMAIILIPTFFFLRFSMKSGRKARAKVLAEWEEHGMDIGAISVLPEQDVAGQGKKVNMQK